MIFVTVGNQLPFDRLVRTIDQWAAANAYGEVFAQIGTAEYRPKHIPWAEFLDADECRRKMEQANVIVAHAGMGSILTALELGKQIVVMPRLTALGEQHNDQQLATAKHLLAQGRIHVAFDESQLLAKLDYLKTRKSAQRIAVGASSALLDALRAFIEGKAIVYPTAAAPAQGPALEPSPEPPPSATSTPIHWHQQSAQDAPGAGRAPAASAPVGPTYPAVHIKTRLAAMILMSGRMRPTNLGRRAGRSRLDLPIDAERTLLGYWRDEAIALAGAWQAGHLSLRVLLDQASPMPTLPPVLPGVRITVERDKSEFRGTGGALHDACAEYDEEDWILVANAAQMLFGPLRPIADSLAAAGGEINVVHDRDGIPNGLILLRCGVLRAISDIGFHDMKEQIIPALAKAHAVKVVATAGLTSRPIHSLKDYTQTLRSYHSHRAQGQAGASVGESWQPQFSIQEHGATVAPSAVIHDSVILQGAVVEKGAVVVRSVVGRGARVRTGEKVFDEIVV